MPPRYFVSDAQPRRALAGQNRSARDEQVGLAEYAMVKRIPRDASLSIFGVS
jgi:hypothetical protein